MYGVAVPISEDLADNYNNETGFQIPYINKVLLEDNQAGEDAEGIHDLRNPLANTNIDPSYTCLHDKLTRSLMSLTTQVLF